MKISDVIIKDLFVVTNINKKSKARMFCNTKVGDVLEISYKMKPVGQNRGTYAHYAEIRNLNTNEDTSISPNQSIFYDNILELEEIFDLEK